MGMMQLLPHPDVAAALLNLVQVGLDFIVIDGQHRPFSDDAIASIARITDSAGIRCFVRVGVGDYRKAELALDLGADGVVFPLVNSAADAKACAAACHYPPIGTRSIGGMPAPTVSEHPSEPICIVQIERADAVEQVDEIFAVEGVDAVLPGVVDLAASTGELFDYSSISGAQAATASLVETVEAAAIRAGVGWFRFCVDRDSARSAADAGCPYLILESDVQLMLAAGTSSFSEISAAFPER
jgi:4-hydroxy-2-oxoheptanedioate aldolase